MRLKRLLYKFSQFELQYKIPLGIYIFFPDLRKYLSTHLPYLNELLNYCFERKAVLNHKENTIDVVSKLNNKQVKITLRNRSSDIPVFNQIIYHEELAFIKKLLHDNSSAQLTIIDAGANIGLSSIYIKYHFANSRIIALEPSTQNVELLNKNITNNSLDNITVINKAIWDKSTFLEEVQLNSSTDYWSYSLKETNNVTSDNKKNIEAISIPDIFNQYHLNSIDYLKIDIEGGERELFSSKENYHIWLPKVKIISLEVHENYISKEVIRVILEEYSFEVFETGELLVGKNKLLY